MDNKDLLIYQLQKENDDLRAQIQNIKEENNKLRLENAGVKELIHFKLNPTMQDVRATYENFKRQGRV